MKKLLQVAVVFTVLSVVALSWAQSGMKGFYVGALGGFTVPQDMSSTMTNSAFSWDTVDYDLELKNGFLMGGKFGWLTPFTGKIMALEIEFNRIAHENEAVKNYGDGTYRVNLQADGTTHLYTWMANVIGRYPHGRVHPYAGLGLGVTYMVFSDLNTTVGGFPMFRIDGESKATPSCQFIAGVDFDLTKNLVLGVSYKYLNPLKTTYETRFLGSMGYIPVEVETNYRSHSMVLSLSYLF